MNFKKIAKTLFGWGKFVYKKWNELPEEDKKEIEEKGKELIKKVKK